MKEHKEAGEDKRIADFHTALQSSFDASEIATRTEDIRNIKITPGENLNDDNVLTRIWKHVTALPSTKMPQLKLQGPDFSLLQKWEDYLEQEKSKIPPITKWTGPLPTNPN